MVVVSDGFSNIVVLILIAIVSGIRIGFVGRM